MKLKRFVAVILAGITLLSFSGCKSEKTGSYDSTAAVNYDALEVLDELKPKYATGFKIEHLSLGYKRIMIDDEEYILVPENMETPAGLPGNITVLNAPLDNVYLVSTAAMDPIIRLSSLERITMAGTDASGWYIDEVREALENGDIIFAGKYSAPDYESIVEMECDLAIENTMIYHNPEVKENLESFGVPVIVEKSSYENEPLGRVEWIKLYGALFDKEDEANRYFEEQETKVASVLEEVKNQTAKTDDVKTVAFFSFNSNGTVTVRKTDDYVPHMIEYAGGKYVFDNLLDETSLSTTNVDLESFYDVASDADILIYNATIEGEISYIQELYDKWPLFEDFKAAKNGMVYCTYKSMYQEVCSVPDIIVDMHKIIESDTIVRADELTYIYPVK